MALVYHSTEGAGIPRASQLNTAEPPTDTLILSGPAEMLGAAASKRLNEKD